MNEELFASSSTLEGGAVAIPFGQEIGRFKEIVRFRWVYSQPPESQELISETSSSRRARGLEEN